MSVYYPSFSYLGQNSKNLGLVVSHFDADSGEIETFLSMDPIYTDNATGTRRIDYGAKYNSVAVFNITVIKQEGGDFSVHEFRNCMKWLTGAQSNSNLDLLFGDEVKYTFTGRFTNASHYKLDARTVGLVLEFTSIAPWAYSAVKTEERKIVTSDEFEINCETDDLYSNVYMKTTYTNDNGDKVIIKNITTNDETKIDNLTANEVITLDNNMMITSSNKTRVFGDDFTFVFPRLQPGVNQFTVEGDGNLKFEYITPVKLGNVAMDINVYSDPICSEDDIIQVDKLPWSRISDTPTTLDGYDIRDAYTKAEINQRFDNITTSNVAWDRITQKPTTVEGYNITDVYTVSEVYRKDETYAKDALYTKTDVNTILQDFAEKNLVYTKSEINQKLDNLVLSDENLNITKLSWNRIIDKPTSIEEYGLTAEITALLSSVKVEIDEDDLNTKLADILV